MKMFHPTPWYFELDDNIEGQVERSLRMLEEQIICEGQNSIAAILLESIVGAGGVLIAPEAYMKGVRALCDRYNILLILDEVMVGFGRTGRFWGFENYKGLMPDIVTSAKGLSAAFLPLSMVGVRQDIHEFFKTQPIGWGATYHAHPVAMAAAYSVVKELLDKDLVTHAKQLEGVMVEELDALVQRHQSVKAGRAIGLFGCLDLVGRDGKNLQMLRDAPPPNVVKFRNAFTDQGLFGLVRAPFLHCAPPLCINEEQLRDGFARLDRALMVLDDCPPCQDA